MVKYECPLCNKNFKKKCNYKYHIENKKNPCVDDNDEETNEDNENIIDEDDSYDIKEPKEIEEHCENEDDEDEDEYEEDEDEEDEEETDSIMNDFEYINNSVLEKINSLMSLENTDHENTNTCMYCDAHFTRHDNLMRHLKNRCKYKKNHEELEALKERLDKIALQMEQLKGSQINNTLNQINNGTIYNNTTTNNNNVNVQLVQFGCENIDDIDINEALEVYYKSTGGNILSNILKLINLNEKYPQNHNICISDLSRELVKIFNGIKFVVKKFKEIKGDIMCKIIKNTQKLVEKLEKNEAIAFNNNIKSKFKINNVSVKLIDGTLPEDIVREEVREKEKLLTESEPENNENDSVDSKKERDFNLEERMRIKHLESKQQDLIEISYERLKNELYNGKDLVEKSTKIIKQNNIILENKKNQLYS
jgi:hypothetical protein